MLLWFITNIIYIICVFKKNEMEWKVLFYFILLFFFCWTLSFPIKSDARNALWNSSAHKLDSSLWFTSHSSGPALYFKRQRRRVCFVLCPSSSSSLSVSPYRSLLQQQQQQHKQEDSLSMEQQGTSAHFRSRFWGVAPHNRRRRRRRRQQARSIPQQPWKE